MNKKIEIITDKENKRIIKKLNKKTKTIKRLLNEEHKQIVDFFEKDTMGNDIYEIYEKPKTYNIRYRIRLRKQK